MIRSTLPVVAICCLLFCGCGSNEKKNPKPKRELTVDWMSELEDWKSSNGPARLAIIEKHQLPYQLEELKTIFAGKTAQELQKVFGEPDKIGKPEFIRNGKGTYVYFLGTTTEGTSFADRQELIWELDQDGNVGDLSHKVEAEDRSQK